MTLDNKLSTIRNSVGLTQKNLALIMGVDTRTVQRWEARSCLPNLTPLEYWTLCSALNSSPEQLARIFHPEAFTDDKTSGGMAVPPEVENSK